MILTDMLGGVDPRFVVAALPSGEQIFVTRVGNGRGEYGVSCSVITLSGTTRRATDEEFSGAMRTLGYFGEEDMRFAEMSKDQRGMIVKNSQPSQN